MADLITGPRYLPSLAVKVGRMAIREWLRTVFGAMGWLGITVIILFLVGTVVVYLFERG
jgi:hypothetical protein